MKNYLVGAIRPIHTKFYPPSQSLLEEQATLQEYKKYEDLYKISRASARKFLAGDWEEVKFVSPVLDARFYQIAQWYTIKELWFREPCNILFMGADTMFVKPTEIFGKYDTMRMFNYTDPKSHPEFPNHFNDDVRYYPGTMNPEVWSVGERRMGDWFSHGENAWGFGQLLHNFQLWSQGLSIEEVLEPHLAWQNISLNESQMYHWNGVPFENAHILHLHSTRGSESRLQYMTQLANRLGIEI
jgi:hypothetical protein